MLERVNLQKSMMEEEYKPEMKRLKARLEILQQDVKKKGLPVIVLFEGWDASGKGGAISSTIQMLDPRNFKVHTFVPADTAEARKPFLWRYWNVIPQKGQIAIMDRSWYQEISVARLDEGLSDSVIEKRIESIKTFERQLTDDGYLIVKFFLHIGKKEQKERLDSLSKSKDTAWRVTEQDKYHNKHYAQYYDAYDAMLEATNTPNAPWYAISSHERRSRTVEIYRILIKAIERALAEKEVKTKKITKASNIVVSDQFRLVEVPELSEIRLDKAVSDGRYKQILKEKQAKLAILHNRLYREKVPVIVVYEGWDAAGKGGNIKRLSEALDPRGYEAIPIAAPSTVELAHHYLWRFWTKMPKTGHLAIFDRSWYGRLMVERIEGFCTEEDWHRAFTEINEFEKELYDWGAIIVKFWLHIDKDEQMKRFTLRQNTPEKQWKITDEDWRNREKWDKYEIAVNDMLKYTSTDFAPWTIVESNDKKFARLKAISTLIDTIESRI